MQLSNLKIGTRLAGAFASILLLLVAIAALGVIHMSNFQKNLHNIAMVNDVEAQFAITMRSSVSQRAIAIRNVVLLTTEAEMRPEVERIQAERQRYKEASEKLAGMFALPGASETEKTLLAQIEEAGAATTPVVEKALTLGQANNTEEATKVLLEEVRPAQRQWLKLLNDLVDYERQMNEVAVAEAKRAYESARSLSAALVAAALALGTIIAVWITRSITRPVRSAMEAAARVAAGDLTGHIEVKSTDEIGQLMRALKEMNDNLRSLILQARDSSEKVSSAAAQLATSAGQVASSSQQQNDAAAAMASAVEEVTVSVNHISENAHEAQKISMESSELSSQGGKVIQDTISEMNKISAAVNESSTIVQELGRQSEQISGVVQVIREVAEQTNLLALNAAIEAARAGEQGRGFAVVADEVRKLAERTSHSTVEISDMIGRIHDGIQAARNSMEAGVGMVSQGVAQANQAGIAVSQINAGSERVVGTVNDISASLREQSAASTEIAQNVERIARMVDENNAAIEETAKTAHELERLATDLHGAVGRFKV